MRIAHDRAGSGPPLVLLHPLGTDRHVWDPVLPRLTGQREVITVDLPGFGESAAMVRADAGRLRLPRRQHGDARRPRRRAGADARPGDPRLARSRPAGHASGVEPEQVVRRGADDAGHIPMWDQPEAVAELLLSGSARAQSSRNPAVTAAAATTTT